MLRRKLVSQVLRTPKLFGFRGTFVDTANLTTYSIPAYLGPPDAKRVVAVGFTTSTASRTVSSCTIAGVAGTVAVAAGQSTELWYANVPKGDIETISVTWNNSLSNCSCSVWSGYPSSPTPVDAVGTQGNTTSLTLTDLAKTSGGFACFVGRGAASGLELSFSSANAMEAIIEDAQNDLEAAATIGAASIPKVIATTTADDFVFTISSSNPCGFAGATWV